LPLYNARCGKPGSDIMQQISRAVVLVAALIAMTDLATARDARSGARQPDFSTCSSARHACVVGTARRGHSQGGCERAYRTCMASGTWDTYDGMYGRRVSGLARR
jgi:hypothetical protein